jgi:hypothetical protein
MVLYFLFSLSTFSFSYDSVFQILFSTVVFYLFLLISVFLLSSYPLFLAFLKRLLLLLISTAPVRVIKGRLRLGSMSVT